MKLFVCDRCGGVDGVELAYPLGTKVKGEFLKTLLCTKCQTGVWHNLFALEPYHPEIDQVINRPTVLGLESVK